MKYLIGHFFQPEPPITQYYGANKDYYAQFGLQLGHEGVDYGAVVGTELYSPFDGIILRDIDNPKSGNYGEYVVVWNPSQKCALWFCHLSDNSVSQGDTVKKGQLIGHTGNTGNSTGPHCHVNFVETDGVGNRLNTGNGNQGFLNLLDYVAFDDSSIQLPVVVQSEDMAVPAYFSGLLQERHLDLNNEGEMRTFFGQADAYVGLKADLQSNQQSLVTQTDKNATLEAQIASLDAVNHTLQAQLDSLKNTSVATPPATPVTPSSFGTVLIAKLQTIWGWIIN